MAMKMLRWLRELVADMTFAAPPPRIDPECMNWISRRVASADPYLLALMDRDAGWYQDRVSLGGWADQQ